MTPIIEQHRAEISALCRRYRVRRLDIFGSAARGADFDANRSDADFLVEFEPCADDLASYIELKEGLESLLGRSVDLVERPAIEASRNYIRRRRILGEAKPVHRG